MHDGRDAAGPLGPDRTSKQHELVTGRMAADFEPFVRVFRHDARRKRAEVLAMLDPLIENIAHVRPARPGAWLRGAVRPAVLTAARISRRSNAGPRNGVE